MIHSALRYYIFQIDSEEINANIKAVDLAVFGHEVETLKVKSIQNE